MQTAARPARLVRFGSFQFDMHAGELRKNGTRLRLPPQASQVLQLLIERQGNLVTREELKASLWPADTFVDFDHSLNNSINRIRELLGDSAEKPQFVETLPKRGYRFLHPVEPVEGSIPTRAPQVLKPAPSVSRIGYALVTLAALTIVAGSLYLWRGRQAAATGQSIRSIAVLPLENLSGDPAQEYFADGMTDALITDLAKINSLRVISRTSVMQYKSVRKPLPQIAHELGVDAIVEGTVTRAGDKVRITAQLIRAVNDSHLWAEDYERDLRDLLALQSAVAHDVAREVRAKLTPEDEKQLAGLRSVAPAAQEAYLRGTFFLNKRTPAGNKAALEYFQQAIALDPEYALPYAGVAEYYLMGGSKGIMDSEGYSKLKAAAEKAIALDPGLAEPHAALGRGAAHEGHGLEAEKHFQTALRLNPNLATAHEWYGLFLVWHGHFEQGVEEFKRAVTLDPASPRVNAHVGGGLTVLRRYDEAIVQLKKALEMDPNLWISHTLLGNAYLGKAMFDEAIVEYRRSLATSGSSPDNLPYDELYIGIAYGLSGRKKEARQILLRTRKFFGQGVDATLVAQLYAALGERQPALQWLQKACRTSDHNCAGILYSSPAFDSLRSDPEFVAIARRSGLAN